MGSKRGKGGKERRREEKKGEKDGKEEKVGIGEYRKGKGMGKRRGKCGEKRSKGKE